MLNGAKKVLRIEAEAILALIDKINGEFAKAMEIILSCKGRVVVTGMGKSGLIGKKIAATLASTGTPALFLHPAEGIHGDLGMVMKGDVIIAISNSGETEEIVKLLPVFKRLVVPVIAMTGGMKSALAKAAEVTIDVGVTEEACPMGLAPTPPRPRLLRWETRWPLRYLRNAALRKRILPVSTRAEAWVRSFFSGSRT